MINRSSVSNILTELFKVIKRDSCIIIDTWHQLLNDENDNAKAKAWMRILREISMQKNLLIVLVAHTGKYNDDIRGASSVSGDVTFKVSIAKTTSDTEFKCTVTKDSLGLLQDSTAIITKEDSITKTKIKYSTEIIEEEQTMKPKDLALQVTMVTTIKNHLKANDRVSIGWFRDYLYDSYNRVNNLKPKDGLFLSNRFIRDNFTDFCTALFEIEQSGRSKYIIGIIND